MRKSRPSKYEATLHEILIRVKKGGRFDTVPGKPIDFSFWSNPIILFSWATSDVVFCALEYNCTLLEYEFEGMILILYVKRPWVKGELTLGSGAVKLGGSKPPRELNGPYF